MYAPARVPSTVECQHLQNVQPSGAKRMNTIVETVQDLEEGEAIAREAADPALPDAFAPLIRNAWYVVAEHAAIGRDLTSIKVLGNPLVIYRTEAGDPVVLDDRCAHRRFPLSKSKLIGNTIQCGYHGFTYEASGRCVWAPGLPVKPGFGVRKYTCAQKGPWLWAWMGDPDRADPAAIPMPTLDADETWRSGTGYKHNPGNYMLLIENLLDLTHLHFLHGAEVSDLTQAETPPKALPMPLNSVGWGKQTARATSGMFAALTGGDPTQVVRVDTWSKQFGPSLNCGAEDRFALDGENHPLYPLRFRVVHALTPEDANNTHQFFQTSFNRDLVGGMDAFVTLARDVVFEQDATAIRYMQSAIRQDRREGSVEFGIPSDRFGVSMRSVLRKMKQAG